MRISALIYINFKIVKWKHEMKIEDKKNEWENFVFDKNSNVSCLKIKAIYGNQTFL